MYRTTSIIVIFCLIICIVYNLKNYDFDSFVEHKPKIALLVSGQTRTLNKVEDNINELIQTIENNNNVQVDVYLSLDVN
uniref:Uncharacterized protein n=1 Tax=Pyramimonas orientalis virus TaxID=455367 RepID=A0A7M3UNT4_POV01|nr:hypothetical protein HWQ62_00230 [Pyramimonas orientalis virus]